MSTTGPMHTSASMLKRVIRSAALLAAVAGAGAGCVSDKSVIAQAADSHRQLEPAIIEDQDVADYVQKVGDRIVEAAKQDVEEGYEKDRVYKQDPSWMFNGDIQFHLVNSKTLNAFTTGGKHVYLYSELFRTCKNEDEFAAVTAHEFSHIVGRHVAKGMQRQYTVLGAAAAAGIGGYALGGDNRSELALALGGGTLVAGQFVGMGFTRNDEGEADKFGFQFYANAGYDPDQFGNFFQTLIDKGLDQSTDLTSDHPLLKNRVADAKKWAEDWKNDHPNWKSMLREPIATDSQFRRLQQKVASLPPPPDDKQGQAAQLMFNSFPSCVATTPQPQQTQARKELASIVQDQQQGAPQAKKKKKHASQ